MHLSIKKGQNEGLETYFGFLCEHISDGVYRRSDVGLQEAAIVLKYGGGRGGSCGGSCGGGGFDVGSPPLCAIVMV
jgi:hypothetical protein